jgi:peptide methionine sulfoxide reductase msrA/msrB
MGLLTAYFACGCFWGAQHYFSQFGGVVSTRVGYMGGHVDRPTYAQVKAGATGHLETTEVTYDSSETNFEELVRFFFEIHDFSQEDGQGPDVGPQYLSAVFVASAREREIAEATIAILRGMGHRVATRVLPAAQFWKAEAYHQNYYAERPDSSPYCHAFHKIF